VSTVEQALEQIFSGVAPLETEQVRLLDALGRVLAEPVVSRREIPPWPNSSMDGYAVRAADTRHGPVSLWIVAQLAAGTLTSTAIGPGQAARIFTGAPLPPGADAVIPQEDVRAEDGSVALGRAVQPGEFVRPQGEDVRAGECVLQPGHAIGAAEIGLLATLGYACVRVHRRPRVSPKRTVRGFAAGVI
jgi:molybdopterin molybdotransferase